MTDTPINLAIIIGSVRPGRAGEMVAKWFRDEAAKHDQFKITVVDLADYPPPLIITNEPPAELAPITEALEAADAFVVVTPEYNHSFPASIKSLIDWHYTQWRGKPVGFVSYGGTASGQRAVEALRLVYAEMHAVTMRDYVSFGIYTGDFGGEDKLPADVEASSTATKVLLDQLAWWALPLREARAKTPYQVAF
ncbi:NAD(P)H-dependent oxidoreductase [Lentzea tibetensis]|uniref:NAD(P)H-dependent oxidoreductase n=1 Tax=Lentzea tibetensis TaxID=2591470 RepID=A0A563ESE3_9PSEU|nr:NAD(P)H-dependent oxidoreductase [Lentzea tibetensis]TWP50522.1 NAD(P)H-dependent oxidoreductase [Lentzea tibetensis]